MKKLLAGIVWMIACCIHINAQVKTLFKIASPDKSTLMEAGLDVNGKIMYRVLFSGEEVVAWSALGFVLNDINAGEKVQVKNKTQHSVDEKFAWRLGEDDTIRNNYNGISLSLVSSSL